MLAASRRPTTALTGWSVEPKFDGWRAMVHVSAGRVCVTSRNGHDLTGHVPVLQQLSGRSLVLDGELVSGAGTLHDFYGLFGALHRREATFVAFDVLEADGTVMVGLSYETRRARLERLDLPGVTVVPRYDGTDSTPFLARVSRAVWKVSCSSVAALSTGPGRDRRTGGR
jgi:bifunctional non-homologous end joining protein LigD